MLHTILIIAALAAVVLIVLYMLSFRFSLLGHSLAFVFTFLARVLVKIQEVFEQAGAYCYRVFENSLNYPPRVTNESWSGLHVIARLVYFLLACCVLFGETANTLLALPALFQVPNDVTLPGGVNLTSGMLFLAVPALYGTVVLECYGIIPYGARLFQHLAEKVRKILGTLCLIGFVLSVLVLLTFWVFRGWYLVDPDNAQVLGVFILGGLGLCVAGSSVIALWSFCVGLVGVASVLAFLAAVVCLGIAQFVSLLPSLLDVLALHLTDGEVSVYQDYLRHDPHKPPASPFPRSRRSLTSPTATAFLPQHAAIVDTDAVHVFPVLTPEKEENMNPENAALVFLGGYGTKMFHPFTQAIARQDATKSFQSSMLLDLEVPHVQTSIPGILDLSPTHAKRKAALLYSETMGQAYQSLLNEFADRVVETHLEWKASPSPLIFFIDCRVLVEAVEMLETIKRRLPLHSLVVATSVAEVDIANKTVQTGLADMQALASEDIVETVIVSDPQSLFVSHHGEETAHHCLANTLVGLSMCHKQSLHNRSFNNVLRDLHSLSPFTAVSFASETVALGDVPKKWAWVPGTKGHAGTGHYGDILAQTRSAITRVITQEDTRTFPAHVQSDASCIVLSAVPLAPNDRRFASCVRDTALFVGMQYPYAKSITVRGNGYPLPHLLGSRFRVGASCLYPLHPQSFPRLQHGKQVNVTPLYPDRTALEPTSGNGHVPVSEQQAEKPSTKTAPLRRQKKTTPALKRVGRKTTKQAQ
jgi:hypothetical protein